MRIIYIFILLAIIFTSFADNVKAESLCNAYFEKYEIEYDLPPYLLKSISTQESGKGNEKGEREPWPWTVNNHGKSFYFKNKKEAVDFVVAQKKRGVKSIDVGCMQINLKHHPDAFKNIDQAFEPQYNIEYAAKLLTEIYNRKHNWMDTVAAYHSGIFYNGNMYATKIASIWKKYLETDNTDYAYINEVNSHLNKNKALNYKVQNSIRERVNSNSLTKKYLF